MMKTKIALMAAFALATAGCFDLGSLGNIGGSPEGAAAGQLRENADCVIIETHEAKNGVKLVRARAFRGENKECLEAFPPQ